MATERPGPTRQPRERALGPKVCKLAENGELARIVAAKLKRRWSPRQIDFGVSTSSNGSGLGTDETTLNRTTIIPPSSNQIDGARIQNNPSTWNLDCQ